MSEDCRAITSASSSREPRKCAYWSSEMQESTYPAPFASLARRRFLASGVGKTTLIHRICHGADPKNLRWTVGCSIEVKVRKLTKRAAVCTALSSAYSAFGRPLQLHLYKNDPTKPFFIEFWDVGGAPRYERSRGVFFKATDGKAPRARAPPRLRAWAHPRSVLHPCRCHVGTRPVEYELLFEPSEVAPSNPRRTPAPSQSAWVAPSCLVDCFAARSKCRRAEAPADSTCLRAHLSLSAISRFRAQHAAFNDADCHAELVS